MRRDRETGNIIHRITRLDTRLTAAVQSIGYSGYGRLMRLATLSGNAEVVTPLMLLLGIHGYYSRLPRLIWAAGITMGLMLAYNGLKYFFRRARPDTEYAAALRTTSFPSGHAADAMACYGLLGYTASHYAGLIGIWIAALCGVWVVAIGVSRVYLGAHYPSDVVAGWVLGGIGLIILVQSLHI